MGGTSWSDIDYSSKVSTRVATTGTAFDYDKKVKTGVVATTVHDKLNPKGLKVRESRDSDAHPTSNSIVVALDVTGSMGAVVRQIHAKLPTLMGLLTRKNYIADPQVMFMAVGDATCDRVPLQVGQFESGAEMEDDLSSLYIESGGGGQQTESYELAAYVGARKTAIDCFEKRGKKGFFFIIGDEFAYSKVKRSEIEELIGSELEADVPTEQIFKELKEKYHVYFVFPKGSSNYGDKGIEKQWAKLVDDEHIIRLEDVDAVAEVIAAQIGLVEGSTDMDAMKDDLKDAGASAAIVKVVERSVATGSVGKGGAIAKVSGTLATTGTSSVTRL